MKLVRSSFLWPVILSALLPFAAQAATYTWTNQMVVGGAFAETSGWTNGIAPTNTADGDILDFSTRDISSGRLITNDISGVIAGAIRFGDTVATAASKWTILGLPVTLANSGAPAEIDATINSQMNCGLAGANGLRKTGASGLVLLGTNTFTGRLEINAGTVSVARATGLGAPDNTVTFSGGATLAESAAMTITNPVVIGNSATVTNENAAAVLLAGTVSGDGSLVKIGAGLLTLTNANTYGGTLLVSGGPVRADDGMGIAAGNVMLTNAVWEFGLDTGRTRIIRAPGTDSNQVSLAGASPGFSACTNDVTVNLGDDGRTLVWGSDFTATTALVLKSATTTNRLTLANGLDLNNASRAIAVNGNPVDAAAVTLSGRITGSGTNLTFTGGGLLVLTGTNDYNAQTIVNTVGAILRADEGVGMPASGNLFLSNGVWEAGMDGSLTNITRTPGTAGAGTVQLTNNAGFSAHGHDVTVSLGGDPPTALVWGAGSFGPTNFILNAATADSRITFRNPLTLGNLARTISVNADVAELAGTLYGATNSLTKAGAGTLVISADNSATATNKVIISAGTLQFNSQAALGAPLPAVSAAHVTLAGGTFRAAGDLAIETNRGVTLTAGSTLDVAEGVTLAVDSKITGGAFILYKQGPGTLALDNPANTNANGLYIYQGTVAAGANGALCSVAPGVYFMGDAELHVTNSFSTARIFPVNNGRTATINVDAGSTLTATAAFGYTPTYYGAVTKTGGGTLIMGGANTYTGATTVAGGLLQISASERIVNTTPLVVDSNATFDLQAFNETVGAVTLANGTITSTTGVLSGAVYHVENGLVSARLGGVAALDKATPGTVVLSGSNTYSGATLINNGTLRIGASDRIANTSPLTIDNGATFDMQGYNETVATVSLTNGTIRGTGVLTGTGYNVKNGVVFVGLAGTGAVNLVKDTSGWVTLNGVSTYTGATTVAAGLLVVNGSLQSAVTVAAGTLSGTGTVANTVMVQAGAALSPGDPYGLAISVLAVSNLVLNTGAGLLFECDPAGGTNDYIAVQKTLTMTGRVDVTVRDVNTGTGVTNTGTYYFMKYGSLAGSVTNLTAAAPANVSYQFDVAGDQIVLYVGGTQALEWVGTDADHSTWGVAGNWSPPETPASGATLLFGAGTSAMATNDGAPGLDLSGITFANNDVAFTLAGADITLRGPVVNSSTQAHTLALPLVLGIQTNEFSARNGDLVAEGVISDAGNARSLVKTGGYTLALRNANTYGGATTISGGALAVENSTALGSAAGGVTVADGASLQLANNIAVGAAALSVAGSGVGGSGALRSLSGTNSYAGAVAMMANTVIGVDADAGLVLPGAVAGGFALAKKGAGTLTLSASNTYSGATAVNEGALLIKDRAALGSVAGGVTVADGASLQLAGNIAVGAESLSVAGSGIGGLGALRSLDGANSYAGTVALAGPATMGVDAGSMLTLTNVITGVAFDLTKDGAGLLVLGASNLYSGGTIISNGTLRLGSQTAAGPATSAKLLFGANAGSKTLQLNGFSPVFTALNGAGAESVVENGAAVPGTLTVSNSAGMSEFDGVLRDGAANALALVKLGAGTLRIGGTNTFTGVTAINGGTLTVTHTNALGYGNAWTSRTVIAAATLVVDLDNPSAGGDFIDEALSCTNAAATLVVTNNNRIIFTGTNQLYAAATNYACTGALLRFAPAGLTDAAFSGAFGLTFDGAGTNEVSRPVNTGVGTITKNGSGVLLLAGSNSYGGITTVNAGTLVVAHSNALGVVAGRTIVTNNAELWLRGGMVFAAEPLDLYGDGMGGNGVLRGVGGASTNGGAIALKTAATIGVDADSDLMLAGIVSGALNLTKTGGGVLRLSNANTYGGMTVISNGMLSVSNATALGPATSAKVMFGSDSNAVLRLNGIGVTVIGLSGDTNSIVENATGSAALTINTAAGTTNIFNGVLRDNGGTLALTKGVAGTLVLGGSNTYGGATTVSLGTLRLGAPEVIPHGTGRGNVAITTAGTCILDMNGFDATLNGLGGAGTVDNVSAGGSVMLTLGDNNQGSTFAGTIKNTTGVVSLTKIGSGTFTMITLASTYGGPTAIRDGAVNIQLADELPVGTVLTLGNDVTSGKLILGAAATGRNQTLAGLYTSGTGATNAVVGGATAVSTLTLNVAGGTTNVFDGMLGGAGTNENILGLTKVGAGMLVLAGSNTYGNAAAIGITKISGGTLSIDGESRLGTTPTSAADVDRLTLDGGTLQATADMSLDAMRGVTVTTNDGAFDVVETKTLAVNGVVTAPVGCDLHKAGNGTLALNGADTTVLVGAKYVDAGTLRLGHAAALGPVANQTMVAPGATLDLNGQTVVLLEPVTLNGAGVSGSGALINSSIVPAVFPGPVTLAGDSSVGGGNMTLSGVIGESGGSRTLTKVGSGTLTLAGAAADTYSGVTFVNEGTLLLGAANKLADTSDVTVNGGIFSIQTFNDTVDRVTLIDGSITGTSGTLIANGFDVRKGTISVNLAGGAAVLTKTTPDTVTLTSVGSTYRGGTLVSEGILRIANPTGSSTGTGGITIGNSGTLDARGMVSGTTLDVQTGGTLTGNGKINVSGAVTVDGTIAPGIPGAAGGTLTLGSAATLTLKAGSTSAFKINGSLRDMIVVGKRGGLTINGTPGATLVNLYDASGASWTPVEGIYNLITYGGAIGGAGTPALDVGNKAPGQNYLFDTDGTHVRLITSTAQIVSIGNASVTEGNTGDTPQLVFTVTVSPAPSTELTVDFATSDGTAKAGAPDSDYVAANGTLHIPAGKTSGQIVVTVLGDVVPEDTETLTVTLSNCSAGGYINGTGTGFIIDDDSHGNVWYVRAGATGVNSGLNWSDAFTSLKDALAAASAPWSIWVAAGTYTPGTQLGDTFTLKSGINIYGGFAGTESLLNARNTVANPTILSGDLGGDDTGGWSNRADNATHVVTGADNATLDGFIISGGCGPGGGMTISAGSPVVRNCVFCNNLNPVGSSGGAIESSGGGAPLFEDCVFSDNRSMGGGGAVHIGDASPTFSRCVFCGSYASWTGGGIEIDVRSSPQVVNCLFVGNHAVAPGGGGGAIRVDGSDWCTPSIINTTFSGNQSDGFSGAIWVRRPSASLTAKNCIFWADFPDELGTADNGMLTATFCDIQGGYDGVSNLGSDPLFTNAPAGVWTAVGTFNAATRQTTLTISSAKWTPNAYAGLTVNPDIRQSLQYYIVTNTATSVTVWGDAVAAGAAVGALFQIYDYRLQAFSPCIDAGTADGAPATDLAGAPRKQGLGFDMGAYEFGAIAVPLSGGLFFIVK